MSDGFLAICIKSTTGKGIETRHFCLSPFEQALMLDLSYGSYPVSFHQSTAQMRNYTNGQNSL